MLIEHSGALGWTFRRQNNRITGGTRLKKMLRRAAGFGCALSILVASVGAAAGPGPRAAPDCPLSLPQGHSSIAKLGGKVVYVDFWASWCVACLASFPFMDQMQRDLGPKGLQVVAVNLDQKPADAQRFLSTHRVGFPVALGSNEACAKQFGVGAMPSTFMVDRNGTIRAVHAGFRSGEGPAIRALIGKLLAERAR
jgi:thiol-disulfide isomerase/thioredoxin